jgi:biotin operon repressor
MVIHPPFVTDCQHKAILAALDGRALTKELLAEATRISAGAINRKLAPLRERGVVVNQRGVGYFRPDAPPVW